MATYNFNNPNDYERMALELPDNQDLALALANFENVYNALVKALSMLDKANKGDANWSRRDWRRLRKNNGWSKDLMRAFRSGSWNGIDAYNPSMGVSRSQERRMRLNSNDFRGMSKLDWRNSAPDLLMKNYLKKVDDLATYTVPDAEPETVTPELTTNQQLFNGYEQSLNGAQGTLRGFYNWAKTNNKLNSLTDGANAMITGGEKGQWNINSEDLYDEGKKVGNWKKTSLDDTNMYQALRKKFESHKKGGQVNYYQQGGQMEALLIQAMVAVVKQAMQQNGLEVSDEQAVLILLSLQQKAQSGDQQAMLLFQQIQQAAQLALTQSAKHGAKLQYIKKLLGQCPNGYTMYYFKAGGKVCSKCVKTQKELVKKAPQTKKMATGGATSFMNEIKTQLHKCGGKVKKGEIGMEFLGNTTIREPKTKTPQAALKSHKKAKSLSLDVIVEKPKKSVMSETPKPTAQELLKYNAILNKGILNATPAERAFVGKINNKYAVYFNEQDKTE